ncbi:MAG: glycosyltransferase [Elusimicrobia bacterium]|nr:glycosyltransferase [Elusimicrobiota bacterium]
MKVYLLYEGRRRDNVVDGRWNVDETLQGALPEVPLSESPWAASLGREFYALLLREWVRQGFIAEGILAAIPSQDPGSRRYAPFGRFDLGGGVKACLIPSAGALLATCPPEPGDWLIVRGPYAYWENIRSAYPWSKVIYYSANGKALSPSYAVDAALVDHPAMALPGVPAVEFDKTCDPAVFRPLGLPKRFDLIVPGAISGKKGQAALSRLLPRDLRVVFAGDFIDLKTGRPVPEVAEIRRNLPNAVLAGHVDHQALNRLYNESRAAVLFSSDDDPAPRVILEAMAAGIPLVAPRGMRYCRKYFRPESGLLAPRWAPFFRRVLRRVLAPGFQPAASFRSHFAPEGAAARLWRDLNTALRPVPALRLLGEAVAIERPGEPAAVLAVRDDLDLTADLLLRLNRLTLADGRPISSACQIDGRATWSYHQYELWWTYLRPFVSHRAALERLLRDGVGRVNLDPSLNRLRPVLEALGIEASPAALESWRSRLWRAACAALTGVSAAAFILRARALGCRVLVFTRDQLDDRLGCDKRLAEVYAFLREKSVPFAECLSGRSGRPMFARALARRRAPLYMRFDSPASLRDEGEFAGCDPSSLPELPEPLVRGMLAFVVDRVGRSRRRTRALRRILSMARFEVLIGLDDPWTGNELLAASQDLGLRTIGVQHGMYSRYHAGWLNYGIPRDRSVAFDTLLVWNDYWKEILERYSSQYGGGNSVVGGPIFPDEAVSSAPQNPGARAVLIPYEAMAPHAELAAYMRRLTAAGVEVIFKARRDVPLTPQLRAYGLQAGSVRVVHELTPAVLRDVAVAAGAYTTVLFDMVRHGKPVARLRTSFAYGHLLVEDDLADEFGPDDSIDRLFSFRPRPEARRRLLAGERNLRASLARSLEGTLT